MRVLVAGVDGGASSTTCVIVDDTGRVLGAGRGGPLAYLYHQAGRTQTRRSISEAFDDAARRARLRRPLRAVVAGLTGLEPASAESRAAVRMLNAVFRAEIVHATWDAEVAFAGAAAGRPGVIVIAGTGAVALGRNAAGQTARAGGYGYLIDDAGGGASIGRAALRAALRSTDGQGPPSILAEMLRSRLGEWPEIRRRVYADGNARVLLASLVPIAQAAAQRGDAVAQRIFSDAGRSLARLVLAVAARLKMRSDPFDLFLLGGVFLAGPLVTAPLRAAVRRGAGRCRIRAPRFPPAVGAALMALEAAGIQPGPAVLRRLKGAVGRKGVG